MPQKATKPQDNAHLRSVRIAFDLSNSSPELEGDRLSLTFPEIMLNGPLVSQEIRQQLVDAGLSPYEVDQMVDEFYIQLQTRLLGHWLAQRRL